MNRIVRSSAGILALGCALSWLSCERPTAPPNPKEPPETKIANVPRDSTLIFPVATINWSGGDYDGFITSYQYRYFTYHQTPGTTTWTLFDSTKWKDTTGTGSLIAFNSSDSVNLQRFLVRAVDNDGLVDPTPAEKIFFTTRASPPVTKILYPTSKMTVLAAERTTDWWSGVSLIFNALDLTKGGSIVAYSWSVDGGPSTWIPDTMVYITPDKFKPPLNGPHTVKVTSRNNTNLVDPIGDSIAITIVVPALNRQVFIIDETDEFNNPFITFGITDSTVDAFYAEIFPGSVTWDFKTKGMPPREVLAQYKLVLWHADDVPASYPHKIAEPANIAVFTDYLNVGGKFLMSGWRILKSFAYTRNFPFAFTQGMFPHDYLHVQTVTETDIMGDCIGGMGKPGSFSDFRVDSMKLAFFPYDGKLSQVNLIITMAGFTDVLYSYVNNENSMYVGYRGRPTALRYYGTVYDAAVLGFPMYFVRKQDAKVMAAELLQSMHF